MTIEEIIRGESKNIDHRNFLDTSCVQVALYDDRLEVISPGGLCYGLTLEDALSGHSKQRNRAVAEVFNQMGLIEAWGTGLQKICRLVKEYGLPAPEFTETTNFFRINLFRRSINAQDGGSLEDASGKYWSSDDEASVKESVKFGESSEKNSVKFGESSVNFGESTVNSTKRKILMLMEENNQISASELAEKLLISSRAVEKNIKELREAKLLVRHGAARGGY